MDASDYTEHRPLMFSIAYRMTGSVSEAEDIVQEAFLRAAKDRADAESPKAYLATITTRLAIDHLRSARVRRESWTCSTARSRPSGRWPTRRSCATSACLPHLAPALARTEPLK
jgi:RNA polymerase sigma factor (sigma-70 family)